MIERRDEVAAAYGRLGAPGADRTHRVRARLDEALRTTLEPQRPELQRLIASLRRAHAEAMPSDKLAQRVEAVLGALPDPLPKDPGELLQVLAAASPLIKVNAGSKKNWADLDGVKADLKAVRETAKRLEEAPRWQPFEAQALQVLAALQEVFDDACRRYRGRKADLSGCDYLDLELEAIRLLEQHPEIAAAYRGRLRHVMVDEAQDLNETQVRLLRLLTGASRRLVGTGNGAASVPGGRRQAVDLPVPRQRRGPLHPLPETDRTLGGLRACADAVVSHPRRVGRGM